VGEDGWEEELRGRDLESPEGADEEMEGGEEPRRELAEPQAGRGHAEALLQQAATRWGALSSR
jgi:hypothetical protein